MKDFLTQLDSIIRGIFTFLGVCFFGVTIYLFVVPNIWGIFIIILFGILGFYLGRFVFITAKRRGILAMSSALQASRDLDNLEPSRNSETRKLTPNQYIKHFQKSELKFVGGPLQIWGDFKSRKLEDNHTIKDIRLLDKRTMKISFQSGNNLTIWNPEIIFDAPTFMKVLKAERIRWEWNEPKSKKKFYYEYQIEGENIRTKTDFDWKSYDIDTLLGAPAIFMYKI
jgi:hypothetical protein